MADEAKKSAEDKGAPDALQQRVTELEALVRKQQALIDELLKSKDNSNAASPEEVAALKKQVKELEGKLLVLQTAQDKNGANNNAEETAALKKRIEELEDKLQKVAMAPPPPSGTPESPESSVTAQPTIPTTGSEKLLPDFSFIIDSVGKTASRRSGDADRNRYLLREAEFAMQGYLYPNIRGDVFFSLEREAGETAFGIDLEEAYASFLNIGKGLQMQAGKKFIDFGRLNQVHSERRLTTDLPLPNKHFLFPEDHGLAGQGVQFNYLLPIKGVFGQLQVGFWRGDEGHHDEEAAAATSLRSLSSLARSRVKRQATNGEEEAEETGLGIMDQIYSARLGFSKELSGGDAELGIGFSGLFGRSEPVERRRPRRTERDDIRLIGMDVQYRRFLGAYKRLLLQSEIMRHHRSGPDGDSRLGYYILGAYRWDRYWDGGLRFDSSSLPSPLSGHETKAVAFVRRFLTEQSFLRFQLERNNLVGRDPFTLLSLQFVWGIGPHSHLLE
jgi:hypothetical protein